MRKGDYGVKVLSGIELASGLVVMKHNNIYSLRISNYNEKLCCNVDITIDGKEIGKFRVDAFSTINIKRPVHEDGQFTFYRHGSAEANLIGLNGKDVEGEIKVVFYPEIRIEDRVSSLKNSELILEDSFFSGGTGLTGRSGQQFQDAASIHEDITNAITIKARLVCEDTPRAL